MSQPPTPNRSVQPSAISRLERPLQRYEVPENSDLKSLVTPDTPIERCPTSLDLANPRHVALAVEAVGVADVQLGAEGKAIVKATHYIIFGDWRNNEQTGAPEPIICTALIDKDGRVFRTTGVFAPRAVRVAAELFSKQEWERGITFVITERMTRERRVAHHISVLVDAEDGTGAES